MTLVVGRRSPVAGRKKKRGWYPGNPWPPRGFFSTSPPPIMHDNEFFSCLRPRIALFRLFLKVAYIICIPNVAYSFCRTVGEIRQRGNYTKKYINHYAVFSKKENKYSKIILVQVCVCVCVFSSHSFWTSSSLDITSRGHTGGRSHRISHPPSFCGACLNFSREKDSAIPFPRRP